MAIHIGRGSEWANPFAGVPRVSRDQALKAYAIYMLESPELVDRLKELDDATLSCGKQHGQLPCHVDVLRELRRLQFDDGLQRYGDNQIAPVQYKIKWTSQREIMAPLVAKLLDRGNKTPRKNKHSFKDIF